MIKIGGVYPTRTAGVFVCITGTVTGVWEKWKGEVFQINSKGQKFSLYPGELWWGERGNYYFTSPHRWDILEIYPPRSPSNGSD